MPIYEYRCTKCGHLLDVLQKMGEAPLLRCPACDEDSLRRMISAPRFRLKGSGWYETDFKKDNRRNLADGGDKPEKAKQADAGAANKTDKKADNKADKKPSKKVDKQGAGTGGSGKPAPKSG